MVNQPQPVSSSRSHRILTALCHLLSSFPPGDKDADRLREWMVNMRRMDWRPVPSSRLCSAHFEEHAFPTDSKGKRCLKKTAIPTLFPDHQVGSSLKGVKRRILKLLSRVRPHH
ncbi:THAP domain-containing protein 5-like isoform X2 [Notolabrus celidotus]|uniref:THAP domain-containing protein 5-like isoform X2 n=1 Tax=Notolabrus celidotus TaxID=1203425 RepID=UPI00149058E5|nr:THAP domain-containing protein 5-like isoform X2 [Notolabrus celidotus]